MEDEILVGTILLRKVVYGECELEDLSTLQKVTISVETVEAIIDFMGYNKEAKP